MVAALGIGQDGRKMILGLRWRATENATVVGERYWGIWTERGFDFTATRLYVLDGGKGALGGGKDTCRRRGADPALSGP